MSAFGRLWGATYGTGATIEQPRKKRRTTNGRPYKVSKSAAPVGARIARPHIVQRAFICVEHKAYFLSADTERALTGKKILLIMTAISGDDGESRERFLFRECSSWLKGC